ncbi:MAG TPA: BamA/TamA family outer membrane protein, partial [bacterium]|nr:BamA/TamA family outer membrane protein [bacterium]
EPVSEEKLRADVRAINDLGWFTDVSGRLEPEPGGVAVVFLVTENPVVAEIVIEGNTVLSAEDIKTALGVPIGEVLNLKTMREGSRGIQKRYEDSGYILAHVADLSVLPADEPGQARLRIRVIEGRVEALRFEGLRKTVPKVAERYVRDTKVGAVFNVNILQKDLQRLFDTGLFESIRARPEPGSAPDTAVIIIEVKEGRTAQASFGLGYSSRDGLLGFIEYRDRNWQGRAQTVVIRAERAVQTGSNQQLNYEISLNEPFFEPNGTALDLSLFSRYTIESEYTTGALTSRYGLQRTGALATLSRSTDGGTITSLRLRSELSQITLLPLDPNSTICPCPPPVGFVPGRVVSFQLGTSRDTRNARFNATDGSIVTLTGELAAAAFGSDFSFTKYTLDAQRLFPVGEKSTIVTRVLLGSAIGNLPLQERYVLGGPSTVRGLPIGFLRDNSIGVANLEYRFPMSALIPSFTDITAILFVDAGNAPLSLNLLVGYGFGVAISTPLGPIRIDLAWGPDGTRQTWLSLGAPF